MRGGALVVVVGGAVVVVGSGTVVVVVVGGAFVVVGDGTVDDEPGRVVPGLAVVGVPGLDVPGLGLAVVPGAIVVSAGTPVEPGCGSTGTPGIGATPARVVTGVAGRTLEPTVPEDDESVAALVEVASGDVSVVPRTDTSGAGRETAACRPVSPPRWPVPATTSNTTPTSTASPPPTAARPGRGNARRRAPRLTSLSQRR
jgi:hypothetical protein